MAKARPRIVSDQALVDILAERPTSTSEMAALLSLTPGGVLQRLRSLERERLVRRVGRGAQTRWVATPVEIPEGGLTVRLRRLDEEIESARRYVELLVDIRSALVAAARLGPSAGTTSGRPR